MNRLWDLLNELPEADPYRYIDLVSEIRAILDDSLLQSLSRIDSSVKSILCNAEEILNNTHRPTSRRMRTFLAKVRDREFDLAEGSAESCWAMHSAIESEAVEDSARPEVTRVRPARRICERPLPNPWGTNQRGVLYSSALRISVGSQTTPRAQLEGQGGTKPLWGKEVTMLMTMGFGDEERIRQALSETNGNVQLAAQLLQSRMS